MVWLYEENKGVNMSQRKREAMMRLSKKDRYDLMETLVKFKTDEEVEKFMR